MSSRPLILLIHGLTGCEAGPYMKMAARAFLAGGYPVLRLNLRGAGPSRLSCKRLYHAGLSADLRVVIQSLDPDLTIDGIVAIGFSLGGNMLLKYAGEEGAAAPILAAVSVSAPIDLKAAQTAIMQPRNTIYQQWLLRKLKSNAISSGAALTQAQRAEIRKMRSVFEFDDRFVGPANGFAGADAYYAASSANQYLSRIRIPTLLIHAVDDPWIPPTAYRNQPWSANPWLLLALSTGGGHLGFHDVDDPTRGDRPWHLRLALTFVRDVTAAAKAKPFH